MLNLPKTGKTSFLDDRRLWLLESVINLEDKSV